MWLEIVDRLLDMLALGGLQMICYESLDFTNFFKMTWRGGKFRRNRYINLASRRWSEFLGLVVSWGLFLPAGEKAFLTLIDSSLPSHLRIQTEKQAIAQYSCIQRKCVKYLFCPIVTSFKQAY